MSVKFHESYCLDSQQDQLIWWDDFLGDQIQDEWNTVFAGGGSAVVVDQQTGGIVRLSTDGNDNDTSTLDWGDIRSLLVIKRASMEVRAKLSSTVVDIMLRLDFSVGNTLMFWYNDDIHTNWRIYTRDGGGTTNPDSGVPPDTDYHIFRIECHIHGGNHAHFYIDGTETANSPISTNITALHLQPQFIITAREAAIKYIDVDYCVVRQEI